MPEKGLYCSNADCGRKIETTRGCAIEITGWEKPRKQGGTNHVYERQKTGRVRCSTCTVKMEYGISSAQLTLA